MNKGKKTTTKKTSSKPATASTQIGTKKCGLCGKTSRLTKTACCGNWICDDEDKYVMFSYARPAVRVSDPHSLPQGALAVLIRSEWKDRAAFGHLEMLCCMHDQQGDPIYLVRNP